MITVDTSVAVAGLVSWHDRHDVARRVLRRKPRLAAHVALETYAVLTRLPHGRRIPPPDAWALLEADFPEPYLSLPPGAHRELLRLLAGANLTGGATYDAVVAATALHAKATLVTFDGRALPTYGAVGADVELAG